MHSICAYTFDFCSFISVTYTTLNKLLAVFYMYYDRIVDAAFQVMAQFQQSLEQGSKAYMSEAYQTAIVHYRTALTLLAKHSDLQVLSVCRYC